MLGALVKAFTGRAGILASLLALLIVVAIALAVILGVPRIEQKLVDSSQTLLQENLAESDVLTSLEAKGRDLYLEGSIQDADAIEAKLAALDGVHHVNIVNTPPPGSAGEEVLVSTELVNDEASVSKDDASDSDVSSVEMAEAHDQDADNSEPLAVSSDIASGESDSADNSGALDDDEMESSEKLDQSSLSLRYDGAELVLSGHVADAQMIELIQAEVEKAIPQGSTLETALDGEGAVSSLGWMDEFLDLVAGLPNDAQGRILGSDQKGVYIEPDTDQTLIQGESTQQANAQIQLKQSDAEVEVAASIGDEPADQAISTESSEAVENAEQENAVEIQAEQQADAQSNQAELDVVVESGADSDAEPLVEPTEAAQNEEQEGDAVAAESSIPVGLSPAEYILWLNKTLATQNVYHSGEIDISDSFAAKLEPLVDIMYRNPSLLLRVVGNIDFSVDPRDAEYVGIDRAREIRDYMRAQGVEPFRVFAAPLPVEYAYDERVQVVFYISE